jgi:antitoxin component YwqK of YwqJK toxin-antitoxin module
MYLFAKIVVKSPDDWWNARLAIFTTIGKDEKHGIWNAWYPAGQPQMRGEYRNDVEVGQFVWWYPNGQKALEGIYDNGRQNGQWTWWHKNGQKATQGAYVQGEQSGRWVVWHEDGRVGQAAEHFPSGQNASKDFPPSQDEKSAQRETQPAAKKR